MTRQQWKKIYRLIRIAKRESLKAMMDTMLYGTGMVRVNKETGEAQHIPFNIIYGREPKRRET
jgi:hypothetical protein